MCRHVVVCSYVVIHSYIVVCSYEIVCSYVICIQTKLQSFCIGIPFLYNRVCVHVLSFYVVSENFLKQFYAMSIKLLNKIICLVVYYVLYVYILYFL